ncbi:MAG: SDR family oxidoreductase [Anaerolineales bacterium]
MILDKFRLDGRTAVVSGGAGLLGTRFCHTLAEAGARLVVGDINYVAAQTVARELNANGYAAIAVELDVTSPQSVHNLVQTTLDQYKTLDILVNSAALDPKFDPGHSGHVNSFEDYPLDLWNQALAVNLTGMFLCSQAASVPMLKQGKGAIINLASIYAITAPDQRLYQRPHQPPQYKPPYYPVTKSAVLGFTTYLAAYFAGKNIRVNAISPGGVFNGHDEEFVRSYSARTVLGRMADKDDMNGALLYLASDASEYVTGANLVVDGGWSIW